MPLVIASTWTRSHFLRACGTTEVVPFPVVALPNPRRRSRGIQCLAKGARHWHPRVVVASADSRFPSASLRAGSHRAFSPIRNDKELRRLTSCLITPFYV
jgi:hypothetical protein